MSITIYHNPHCGTSRKTLALIEESGQEFNVVEYVKEGWSEDLLRSLFSAAGISPKDAIRKGNLSDEQQDLYDKDSLTDEEWVALMVKEPILVQRPIVNTPKGVRICRPADLVQEIL